MFSKHCKSCRFLTTNGCRKQMCAVVRCHRRGDGLSIPDIPVEVLAPEPVSPLGIAGFVVGDAEFPPTDEGYIAARGFQGQLEDAGYQPEFKELRTEEG